MGVFFVKKKVIKILATVFAIVLVVVVFLSYLPPVLHSTIYFSLEKDEEYIGKLSDEDYSDYTGKEYLKSGYVPYKVLVQFENVSAQSCDYIFVPKIQTEEFIMDIHGFDTPHYGNVVGFKTEKREDVVWFKENLSQIDIERIVNELNFDIEIVYDAGFSPFTLNEKTVHTNCEVILNK